MLLTEQMWEDEYPSRRGFPRKLLNYFRDSRKAPIMTGGDSILQLGNNAYGKPAVALNILRETVLGRELFDHAFREYARRWMFKKPEPADFFRTMEDASGTDLDWFWRGWFYSTDSTDISLKGLTRYTKNTGNPDLDREVDRVEKEDEPDEITRLRNADLEKRIDAHPELADFYDEYDKFEVYDDARDEYQDMLDELTDRERELLDMTSNFYVAEFENLGGLVMPVILKVNYTDGSSETVRFPAEIWRYNNAAVSKMLITEKEIESLEIDPLRETGDIDHENNYFPRRIQEKRFDLKPNEDPKKNPMQKAFDREEKANEDN